MEDNTDNKKGIISIRVGAGKTGNPQRKGDEKIAQKDLGILKNNLEQKIEMNQIIISISVKSLKNEMNFKLIQLEMDDLKFDNQYLKFETLLNKKFNVQREKQNTNNK